MKKEARTHTKHAPSAAEVKVAQAVAAGRTTCVLSWDEFEALRENAQVVQEQREIFQDLGVMGYFDGMVTLFNSGNWADGPLTFRDAQDL